jgi:hypothetical protein
VTHAILAASGGFLIAVLWMDLMFDVQVLRKKDPLPEPVLDSIAAYYRRVTTEASPMGRLVALVMAVAVATVLVELVRGPARWTGALSLLLLLPPLGLAQLRIFPAAVRLGARGDPRDVQTRLARAICRDHLLCLAAMLAFTALQLVAAAGR